MVDVLVIGVTILAALAAGHAIGLGEDRRRRIVNVGLLRKACFLPAVAMVAWVDGLLGLAAWLLAGLALGAIVDVGYDAGQAARLEQKAAASRDGLQRQLQDEFRDDLADIEVVTEDGTYSVTGRAISPRAMDAGFENELDRWLTDRGHVAATISISTDAGDV